jgi:hypothetical protein
MTTQTFYVTCSNPACEKDIAWEDATKDIYENFVCVWCQSDGYKSPEAIINDCMLDDDEIEKRVGYTAWWNRVSEDTLHCPVCGTLGEVYNRDAISHVFPFPHAECVCHTCNEMFWVLDI